MKLKVALILGLCLFAVNSTNTLLSTMLPLVTAEFALTPFMAGLLVSTYGWAYAAMQVPVGLASDRYSPRRILVYAMSILLLSALLFAASTSDTALLITRLVMGAASSFVFIMGLKTISLHYQRVERGRGTGLFLAVGSGGISIVNIAAPLAVQYLVVGWRTMYLLMGALTFVAVILVFGGLPRDDEAPYASAEASGERVRIWSALAAVSRNRHFWVQNVIAFVYFGTLLGFLFWLPTYFQQSGLGLGYGGVAVSLLGAGSVCGFAFIGWLLDRFRRNTVLRVFLSLFTLLFGYFIIVPLKPGLIPEAMAVSFLVGMTQGGESAVIRIIGELFDHGLAGTAYGIYNTSCWLGSAFFPVVIGSLLSAGFGFQVAFAPLGLSCVVALCASAFSHETKV